MGRAAGRDPAFVGPPAPPYGASDPTGRVLIAELNPDEFVLMGFDSAVSFRPSQGSEFTAAQLLSVQEGRFDNGVWKTSRERATPQGANSPATVSLPEEGAMIRVNLVRY